MNHSALLPRTLAKLLVATTAIALAGCSGPTGAAGASEDEEGTTTLTIAEPVHGVGYLPLYAAIDQGFFADADLEVEVTTLTGGGHVNATLAGEVFGFIGGPESGAVANVKGADLVTVANVVNRGNVYFVAPEGEEPAEGEALAEYFRGKIIVGGRHGGTPNAILRHILIQEGLDPDSDVELIEVEDSSAIPSTMQQGAADIAVVAEPQLGLGIQEGLWTEPFLNPLELLGPYAYSSIVIPRATGEQDPELVSAFVAALAEGQQLVESDPEYAFELATAEFPTMEPDVLQETLDRAYEDQLWEGTCLAPDAVEVALEVARNGEILDDSSVPQTFENAATTQFTEGVC